MLAGRTRLHLDRVAGPDENYHSAHGQPKRFFANRRFQGHVKAVEEVDMSVLVPMTGAFFPGFLEGAIEDYARQNVVSGRWRAESALALSRAEHARLLPDGLATKDMHLYEIRERATGETVGSLWLGIQSTAGVRSGYVFSVDVFEAQRRRGHARRAFEALDPLARELGLAAIGLQVFAFNTGAQALYAASGYRVTASSMRKSFPCDDAAPPTAAA